MKRPKGHSVALLDAEGRVLATGTSVWSPTLRAVEQRTPGARWAVWDRQTKAYDPDWWTKQRHGGATS